MPRYAWFLLLLALAVYLAGNGRVALWDRDEPRYAQCSRQMLQSGDWVVPHLYDSVRYAKPPLIYWCQATCMKVFGDDAFAARLPSALAMVMTLAIVWIAIGRGVGWRRAGWTAFVLGTSALAVAAAKMCLTDSVLLVFMTVSQLCVFAFLRGKANWLTVIVYAIATGVGGLTKGPVILGVQGMTVVVYWAMTRFFVARASRPRFRTIAGETPAPRTGVRSLEILKVLLAMAIIAMIIAPWMVLVERRSPGFIMHSLRHDVVQRMETGLEGHSAPPGYYLATIWGSYFPWSLLLPGTLVLAWKRRRLPMIRFAFAAVVGPWVMFEIFGTKLPHYILPVFPALAFLTADAVVLGIRRKHRAFSDAGFRIATGIWALVIAALALAAWFAVRDFLVSMIATTALSAVTVVYVACVFAMFAKGRIRSAAIAMGAGFMLVVIVLYRIYLPTAAFLRLSPRIAADMIARHATTPGQEIMLDYQEPSLAFHQGGTLRERRDEFLLTTPVSEWPRWIVMTDKVWNELPDDRKNALETVAQYEGINLADHARRVNVRLMEKK